MIIEKQDKTGFVILGELAELYITEEDLASFGGAKKEYVVCFSAGEKIAIG